MSRPEILEPAAAYALWAASYPVQADNPVMRAEQRAMLDLMPADLQGCAVLDAGCGRGRYMLQALRRGASRVSGVDLSPQMLERAQFELDAYRGSAGIRLMQGDLTAIALPDGWADLTVCGLVVGHLHDLQQALRELHRVTRLGGTVLCSDLHPIGKALGWVRDFKSGNRRYVVRHTRHQYSHWHAACTALGLQMERVVEPMLEPADIPAGAHFDPVALEVPVVLVFKLKRSG
jgi:malonyl-CoA O-methyltransferase